LNLERHPAEAGRQNELEPAGAVDRPSSRKGRPGTPGIRARHGQPIVSIILQSTIGGFSGEFMRKLPKVEEAMIAHGLELSQFVISKDRATPATVRFAGPFFHDYTVFFDDGHFTVTEPNDMKFLDYFYQLVKAMDDPPPEPPRRSIIHSIFRWMEQPI
jgi:hypothetical protein